MKQACDDIGDFEQILFLSQSKTKIEYGIIHGNDTIIFIKPGSGGSYYGHENKYLKIAKSLHAKHGCTVISSSNPLGYLNDVSIEMDFIRDYASKHEMQDYKVYYLGHSNGAALGIINAYKYPEIKRLVCINGPLMTQPQQVIRGIKEFSEDKMFLVYGSKDSSFRMVKMYSELESEKINFISIYGADHNFTECMDLFIELPGALFFGDALSCKNVKIHQ